MTVVWTNVPRGFVVHAHYENEHSVITTQKACRLRFGISRNASVHSANTIQF